MGERRQWGVVCGRRAVRGGRHHLDLQRHLGEGGVIPKRNMVTYEASDAIHRVGEPNDVELVVTDEAGNQTVWARTLKWP